MNPRIRISEPRKKPGVAYVVSDDGVELPVIDLTHPSFDVAELEARLPESTAAFIADTRRREKLPKFVGNLVMNATRFAETITITGHRDHRWLTLTIDDNGPGIPQAMREDVFKPFLRLDDEHNADAGGTGLGLAIARDIARSHGGDIVLGDSPLGGCGRRCGCRCRRRRCHLLITPLGQQHRDSDARRGGVTFRNPSRC